MCDIEFTIEQGKLWMLQTRVGKRTAAAALHIAIEMEKEGLITKEEAVCRVDPEQLDQLLHPQFDKNASLRRARSRPERFPGRCCGRGRVLALPTPWPPPRRARKCVLVRWETNSRRPRRHDRRRGHPHLAMAARPSHAAVIARGMGAPCVCGVEALQASTLRRRKPRVAGTDVVIHEGDMISLDGTTGIVVLGAVELVLPELTGDLDTILEWADEFRTPGCARQRRQPGGRAAFPRLRRRGHRPRAAPSTCSWASASRSFRPSS